MAAAKQGLAAVTVCSSTFAELGHAQASALGLPDLPIAVIPHPFGTRSRQEIRALAIACADDIAQLLCAPAPADVRRTKSPADQAAKALDLADDLDAINRLFRERNWSDGLPIVPPTPERVARMLEHTKRRPTDVVAAIAPVFGHATVEAIAINAVMAGCDPEYLPVLIAATEAMADADFNLQVIQTTTHPVAVMLVVNGPIARRLQINGGTNCLGPGAWANATLGRALRLIQQNIGGAWPGKSDQATQGQPGKYTFCCSENEEASPWEPLHVERGHARDADTVTVFGAAGTSNIITHARDVTDLVRTIAGTMRVPATLEYVYGGYPLLVLAPEHAAVFASAGLTKADVKRLVWDQSKLPARDLAAKDLGRTQNARRAELGEIRPDTLLPVSVSADDIHIIVAGGPGTHSIFVPIFATSRPITHIVDA